MKKTEITCDKCLKIIDSKIRWSQHGVDEFPDALYAAMCGLYHGNTGKELDLCRWRFASIACDMSRALFKSFKSDTRIKND